ncbi:MAG TPA: lysylphosphatidylglycerol synthase transmembrane domain-containing protein [Candidatus Limnocylindrales bacterium]|nr:lysylphosphatidylglycerol synthase transmembrane domain-containing protein [Candidatus Limnocylindrales bacterium]
MHFFHHSNQIKPKAFLQVEKGKSYAVLSKERIFLLLKRGVRPVVCISLLGFLFSRVPLSDFFALIAKVPFQKLFLAFLLYLTGQIFFVLRWEVLLHILNLRVSRLRLTALHFLGLFFSFLLPTSVGGDLIRAFYLSRDTCKTGISFLSVFTDRYMAFLTVLFTATFTAWVSQITLQDLLLYPWLVGLSLMVILINILLGRGYPAYGIYLLPSPFRPFQDTLVTMNHSLQLIFKHKKALCLTLPLSLAFLFLSAEAHQMLIQAMGKSIEFKYLLLFIPLIALAGSIPISIGGIGLRESAYVYLFSGMGFTATESLALASFIFIIWLAVSLPGLGVYLFMGTKPGVRAEPLPVQDLRVEELKPEVFQPGN